MVMKKYTLDPGQLTKLYSKLIGNGIVIQPMQISLEDGGSIVCYDILDIWWDLSLHMGAERSFPDQTRRRLSYKNACIHGEMIVRLIKKYYPRMTDDEEQ